MRRRLAALVGLLLAGAVQAATGVGNQCRWPLASGGRRSCADRSSTRAGSPFDSHVAPAVAGVFDAPPRRSFVVVFDSLPELWEISYDPQAEPIYQGLVHDYRLREGIAEPGFLNARRTRLDAPLRDPGFDSSHAFVIARAPDR